MPKSIKEIPGLAELDLAGNRAVYPALAIFHHHWHGHRGQKMQVSSVLNAPLLQYLIYHSTSYGRPGAGPAITLSFVLVAHRLRFRSVCYAELAAMIPIAGSAYTYTLRHHG